MRVLGADAVMGDHDGSETTGALEKNNDTRLIMPGSAGAWSLRC